MSKFISPCRLGQQRRRANSSNRDVRRRIRNRAPKKDRDYAPNRSCTYTVLIRLLTIVSSLFIWGLLAWLIDKPLLFAGPIETFFAFCTLLATQAFWVAIGISFAQILGGFFSAFLLSLCLAFLSLESRIVKEFLRPAMNFLKSVPVVCIIVILLLWMESAQTVPVVVGLMVLPSYYFSILTAQDEKNNQRTEALRLMGVSAPRRFLTEGWSSLLPYLKATSSSVVGMAWKAGVAAQLIGLALGTLGERVYQAKVLIEAPTLFALSAVIVLCAFLSEKIWMLLLDASQKCFPAVALWLNGPTDDGTNSHARSQAKLSGNGFLVQNVSISFNGKVVLKDLSFTLPPSLFVTGRSGIGKTTLCKVLLGLVAPDSGNIRRPKRIGVVFQQPTLIPSLSVRQNLALVSPREKRDEALSALKQIAPDINVEQAVRTLSGGQTRRVEIVRALFSSTHALILDEPFVGLDEKSKEKAVKLIREVQAKQERPLLLVSHGKTDGSALNLKTLSL